MNEDEYIVNNANYRKIIVNGEQVAKFASNAISTTKYSLLTFVPLFLYEQFHNYTNCFFLLISIIQQFPEASSLGRFTTLIPLCIILSVSAIKEILEDVNRHRGDRRVNRQTVCVLKNYQWSRVEWQRVQVGDVVKVLSDDFFPADLLLLKSNTEAGVCYIETVNLDGENNLKIRRRVPGVNFDPTVGPSGVVECDLPNEKIYSFSGVFKVKSNVTVPLAADHVLLRGAILRNTEWIVGVVIYTGSETKIMKNSSNTRLKRSSVSAMVNSHIVVLFGLFLSYTFLHWILSIVWNNRHYARIWYMPMKHQELGEPFTIILCLIFGVIYSILIPISLQVMQELSRFIQGMFIANDIDMYYEPKDQPAMVKTSSLNEDLALVKYIFADKTGTLTKNVLEFKRCSVGGTIYTLEQLRRLSGGKPKADDVLGHFFVAVCTCPGVIPVRSGDADDGGDGGISYYASSPDQKALIMAAREFDYVLTGRTHNWVELEIRGEPRRYDVLSDFEFSSERKRTSVIVRNPASELFLYALGADDVILPHCGLKSKNANSTRLHIGQFASEGMRSLCVAMRKIEPKDFDAWYPTFKKARESLSTKENLMEAAESLMLKNLTLLGCTAVEDKLQDDVPQTIEALQQAGISMWVLTGDREETAVNVGYACRLLSHETPLIVLNTCDLIKLRGTIVRYKRHLGALFGRPGNNYGLLVTGDSLNLLFDSKPDAHNFVQLMLSCRSVICCRTTPKQKALVVKNVQKCTNYVTLAIGDGANDVAMIQTASIGVGISGMEGLQAANAADYAIGQFKYLKKLLLVHGTWSYNRICKMIYFIYYKNVAIATIQLYYTGTNGWSGQLFLDRWAKMLYNVLLTSAPTLALGIFEQNLPSQTLLRHPFVYTKNDWFNLKSFYLCLFNAIAHSVLLSWLSLRVFGSCVLWSSGHNDNYMVLGNVVYTSLILIICLKCGLHSYHWTNITVLFMILSEVSWLLVFALLSHTWPWIYAGEDMPCMFEDLLSTPLVWLFLSFVVVAILLCDSVCVILYRVFREPTINALKTSSSSSLSSSSHDTSRIRILT